MRSQMSMALWQNSIPENHKARRENVCVAVPKNGMESIATKVLVYYHATDWKGHGYLALRQEPTGGSIFDKGTRSQRSSELYNLYSGYIRRSNARGYRGMASRSTLELVPPL